jgi:predicted transcriptional regulator
MPQTILEMAKDLVQAQVQAGQLSPEAMQEALQSTYASLVTLKTQEETGTSTAAIPQTADWKKSITRHAITCLECGQSFKQLSLRHLRHHNLDGRLYREKYGIPRTLPLAARATTARRREVVQETRPWEKTPTYVKSQEEKTKVAKKGTRRKRARAKG